MADKSQLEILKQGVEAWNSWMERPPIVNLETKMADPPEASLPSVNLFEADLSGMDLSGVNFRRVYLTRANLSNANLSGANLSWATLIGTNFSRANLTEARCHYANSWGAIFSGAGLVEADFMAADLRGANFSGSNLTRAFLGAANLSRANFLEAKLSGAFLLDADLSQTDLSTVRADASGRASLTSLMLSEANLIKSNLSGVNLSEANLYGARLSEANLSGANLSRADLTNSDLVKANLEGAILEGCRIYGISAWSVKLEGAKQQNLNVSDYQEPAVIVDNLEVAQFIYLLLNNERIRQVIDTITSKVVLILGRFTAERKVVLEAIRDSLRRHGYLPVLFDSDKPSSRDLTETVSTLAHLARFIIADITDARGIPQELQAIVPNLPSVPVQPLLLASEPEYGMFERFKHYPWVLDTFYYDSVDEVLASLETKIIAPAEAKAGEAPR